MKKVVLFGDFGKDLDDEIALAVLASYVKQEKVQLVGIVATGKPANLRARIAKGMLDEIGIDAPVFVGSDISLGTTHDYESKIPYLASTDKVLPLDGLKKIINSFEDKELSMVIQCALTDANAENIDLMKFNEIALQGGILNKDGIITPDLNGYNCATDKKSAKEFFKKIQNIGVPLQVIDREVVYNSAIDNNFYNEMSEINPVIGDCLKKRFQEAIRSLWRGVHAPEGSELRGSIPIRCTPKWFLETYCDKNVIIPEGDDITEYVKRSNLYDPINIIALFEKENLFHSSESFHISKSGLKNKSNQWVVERLEANNPEQVKQILIREILNGLKK